MGGAHNGSPVLATDLEHALRASGDRYHRLVEALNDGAVVLEASGAIVTSNSRAQGRPVAWTARRLLTALAILLGLKETQEWAIHWARLFDQITFTDALQVIWRTVTGG